MVVWQMPAIVQVVISMISINGISGTWPYIWSNTTTRGGNGTSSDKVLSLWGVLLGCASIRKFLPCHSGSLIHSCLLHQHQWVAAKWCEHWHSGLRLGLWGMGSPECSWDITVTHFGIIWGLLNAGGKKMAPAGGGA